MSGGFFRGTSADQDSRFSNKQAKLLKTQKFPPELEHLVDITKVKMDVIKPWIANRVTELLGFEDEVLINFIYGLLDVKEVNGKEVQIQLTGFMEKNTGKFMKELWSLLLSAQKNASGVPQQFLDAKEEETRKKKDEADRIANEIHKKREKEIRELEQERSRKMDAGAETKTREDGRDRASKHVLSKSSGVHGEEEAGSDERNGVRGRKKFSTSPSSPDRRSSGRGRNRSRSRSRSPATRGRSVSSERGFRSRSPRKQSITPRRKHSPQRSFSPRRRSPYSMKRSRLRRSPSSPARRRLQSPYRRRSPSPVYRRSPSPPRRRRRSPSPVRRVRSPSPVRRRRSPSPVRRRRSPSPLRRRRSPSPVRRRRSPSPVRRRRSPSSPSPVRYRSPGVSRRRYQISPSRRRASPSPVVGRSLSPTEDRSLSPVHHRPPIHQRSPSPNECSSQSPPARGRSRSPVRRRSPKPRRSPMDTPKDDIRSQKLSREAHRPSISARGVGNGLRSKVSHLSRSPRTSPVMSNSDRSRSFSGERRSSTPSRSPKRKSTPSRSPKRKSRLHRSRRVSPSPPRKRKEKRSPNDVPEASKEEEYMRAREGRVHEPKTLQNRKSPSVERQREKLMTVQEEEQHFDQSSTREVVESHGHYDSTESRKDRELSGKSTVVDVDRRRADPYSSPTYTKELKKHAANAEGGQIYNEKSPFRSRSFRERDQPDRLYGSGSEESEKQGVDDEEGRKKHKRSRRHEVASDDSNSSDSGYEERKEAKRRKKEERKLRKEEKRQRREERRRRKEERRSKKLRSKSRNNGSSDGEHVGSKYHSSDGETETEKKRLEIELRNKALESLKAKKGMSP